MEKKEQEKPLAPRAPAAYDRQVTTMILISEDEALSMQLDKQRHRFLKHIKCCGVVTAIFLILIVTLLVVLSFTLLHIKNPEIRMNSVAILGLDQVNSTMPSFSTGTNLSVMVDVSVKNPNAASFRFQNATTSLLYEGVMVGEGSIPAGVAKARRTLRMNVTFEIMVADMVAVPQLGSDLAAGLLPMRSYTSIRGRVKILKMIKKNMVVNMNCTMNVNVTSQAIQDQDCQRHVSL